jgi:integrase
MTVRHLHAVLHGALDDAARWGLVARNVADLVAPPRAARKGMITLSPDQARALLDTTRGDRLEALYVLALTTGMRQGELLALRWRDVDLDRHTLHVTGSLLTTPDGWKISDPKTDSSRRRITLTATAVDALRRHRSAQNEERLRLGGAWEDNDLVFANEVGRPIEVRNLMRRSFLPLLKQSGLPRIRFHDLRHTAATLLLGQGQHPKVVAEMLGHSRISTTLDLYSHVTPTMQREAADAMDAMLGRGVAR